jgi:acyl-CoA thioesterase
MDMPDPAEITRAMYDKDTASQALGIEIEVTEAGSAVARMRVRSDMINGFGVCHGGLIFTLADIAFACNGTGSVTLAAAASIEFLKPARAGDDLVAVAEERNRGRKSGIYDVTVTNKAGDRVALFRGRSHDTWEAHPGG